MNDEKPKSSFMPGTCNVCNQQKEVGVACVPGMPVSMAYCRECLAANAHPYGLLVAETAACGGYNNLCDEFKEMIDDTLRHLKMTREKFDENVANCLRESPPEKPEWVDLANQMLDDPTCNLSPFLREAWMLCLAEAGWPRV